MLLAFVLLYVQDFSCLHHKKQRKYEIPDKSVEGDVFDDDEKFGGAVTFVKVISSFVHLIRPQ